MPLLVSRGLPLGAKGKMYSACVSYVMPCGSETWLFKEEDVIRLEWKHSRMMRCNPMLGQRVGFLQSNLELQ